MGRATAGERWRRLTAALVLSFIAVTFLVQPAVHPHPDENNHVKTGPRKAKIERARSMQSSESSSTSKPARLNLETIILPTSTSHSPPPSSPSDEEPTTSRIPAQEPSPISNIATSTTDTQNNASVASPFDLIVGATHHKTGTYQLRCMLKYWALHSDPRLSQPLKPCFWDNGVTAETLEECVNTRLRQRNPPALRPFLYKTFHGLTQTCYPPADSEDQEPWEPCLSFMVYKRCKQRDIEMMMRPSNNCTIAQLPPEKYSMAFFNFIRNPIDAVLSAYAFHVTRPNSEPWLFRPQNVSSVAQGLLWAGMEQDTLWKLRLGRRHWNESVPYVDLLNRLPTEQGIILEYWHSLPELASQARQYKILQGHPSAFHARFEGLRDDFNATVASALKHLRLGSDEQKMLDVVVENGCDPNTWTEKQRAANNHITIGKLDGVREAAEVALMAYPPAKTVLCQMIADLNYTDPRCTEIEKQVALE